MIKTIVVPINIAEKEPGVAALDLAQDMAKAHGAKLVLLSVVETVPNYIAAQLPKGTRDKALAEAGTRLEEIAKAQGLAGTAEVVVRDGHAPTEILDYANKIGADMIVIGSHNPGVAAYFLGSVAARVVRHAHCSVLVARKLDD